MILKIRQGDSWRFIDNISVATTLPVKEGEYFDGCTGAVQYEVGSNNPSKAYTDLLIQPFDGEAYLLNNNGKTIENLSAGIMAT